jgi:hypothetical protein
LGDKTSEVLELMQSTNWLDARSKKDFIRSYTELNGELANSAKLATEVADAFTYAAEAQSLTIKELTEKVANLHSVTSSLTRAGDTISAEDYDMLSLEMQSYFKQMADGTYMLTASAAEFFGVAKQGAEKRLSSTLEGLQSKRANLNQNRADLE